MVVLMVVAIGIATLTPSDQLNSWPWYCLWCDEQALADAIVNVVMFVPLGFSLRAAGVPARFAILACAAFAATVEIMQGTAIAGRDPSLRDALTNTLGAAIGVLIAAQWHRLLFPSRRAAAWLAGGAAMVWLSVLTVSGLAVQPCAPPTPYDAEWSPLLPNESPFRGRVVGATLYGDSLLDGPKPDAVRDRFETGRIALTMRVIPDDDRFNSAPMLAVVGFQRVALSIAHSRRGVVVSLPQCSWRLRLRPTLFALSRGLEVAFADGRTGKALVEVGATRERLTIATSNDEGSQHLATSLGITPFLGWSLVRPFDARVRAGTRWITALWIAGLLLPFGYWVANGAALWEERNRVRGYARFALAVSVVMVAGLVGISRALTLSPADVSDVVSAIAGVGGGAFAARRMRERLLP